MVRHEADMPPGRMHFCRHEPLRVVCLRRPLERPFPATVHVHEGGRVRHTTDSSMMNAVLFNR